MNIPPPQPQVREPNTFGRRKEPHSIVITRNGRSRQFSVNPLYFTALFGILVMFSVGYFAATTYLILRDDLISARVARNARMQHEYEDRIAALRANLDRVTSRQLLDQQAIEAKVSQLVARQEQLVGNGESMQAIVDKAANFGLKTPVQGVDNTVTGSIVPQKQTKLSPLNTAPTFGQAFSLRGLDAQQNIELALVETVVEKVGEPLVAITASRLGNFSYRANDKLFANLSDAITGVNVERKQTISKLRRQAATKLTKIAGLMKKVGVKLKRKSLKNVQIGGPFEPLDEKADFRSQLDALEVTLGALDYAQKRVGVVPVANPVPGHSLSSKFGSRIDPFKGTYAMHSGLDFKGKYGTPVSATAKGKVIFAGRKGGYGKMVEIQHINGLTTKYAHLSKIMVRNGQKIAAGGTIGKIGSTGRSTGPHLHYEVRKHGIAVNPKKYLNVGKKLAKLM